MAQCKMGIYKIVNTINNKIYIGSTKRMSARKAEHRYRYKNHKGNSAIRSAVLKYGEDNFRFEVVEELIFGSFATIEYIDELLSSREQFYVDILHPEYNIKLKDVTRNTGVCSEAQREHLKRICRLPKDKTIYRKSIYELDKFGNIIREFRCAQDAERELNLSSGNVSRVLSKKRPHTKHHYFKLKTINHECPV